MEGPGYSGHAGCVTVSRHRSNVYGNIPQPNCGNVTGFCGIRRVYQETDHDQEQCGSHHDLTGIRRVCLRLVLSWVGDTPKLLTAIT
ncbi:MAG: hypothetical protein ABR999_07835 [Methanoregula sp.]|uniref:hypothetical protein n=1 Tax=Methanoregula sp. TaxID=2052170 RepID=UPI003D09E8AF